MTLLHNASGVFAVLPLTLVYTTSYRSFALQKAKQDLIEMTVAGGEKVTVPAGEIDAWKVEFSSAGSGTKGTVGYQTPLWTCPRVAHLIEQGFGVEYHAGHVWKILVGLGWSPQRPVGRARERNEVAIRTWKRKTWPAI